ncbi:CorA family divalent cation transporter [Nonomuraea endophytica]|uniref:Mg2+ and Co2+ transporter CorA n=1 Tax=Nonomuraea endophytica TaxID=714136 RepID=A0A7W8EMM2_9ACTN|nr:CorA family divalent cation transporter [Nonomuraea endophytica]MBB5084836.1 Mg2+ and Co2+ transporter CorA [Nonomuraea endophytica]
MLARAARHLRVELDAEQAQPDGLLYILIADIDGVKEHARYEHDKVRYLQQSIMTSPDVKQNQIVKVFTIITAVFLPPTLIATFYGMNFTMMPELAWDHDLADAGGGADPALVHLAQGLAAPRLTASPSCGKASKGPCRPRR